MDRVGSGDVLSFGPQAPDRIGQRSPYRDVADTQQGDKDRPRACQREYPPIDAGTVGIIIQPVVHDPPRERKGKHARHEHQLDKITGKEAGNKQDRGPQHFSHADLLCPSFGGIACETEQPQTGDEHGETGKDGGKATGQRFGFELCDEILVQELVFERVARVIGFRHGPDCRDGFGNIRIRFQAHRKEIGARRITIQDERRRILVHVVVDKIPDDADDAVFILAVADEGADRIAFGDEVRKALVDDDAVAILCRDLVEIAAGCQLHAHGGNIFRRDVLLRDEHFFARVLAGPVETAAIAVQREDGASAEGSILHESGMEEVIADGREVVLHLPLQVHIEQPLFFVTQVAMLDVFELLVDDDSRNDEDDGGGKLQHDETFADKDCPAGGLHFHTLQYIDRVERGEVERRVRAGEEAAQKTDRQEGGKMCRVQEVQYELFFHQGIECGQRQRGETERNDNGEKRHEYGFADELSHQLAFACAEDLADTDFAGAFFRAGSGKVHEIDAGDDQNDP